MQKSRIVGLDLLRAIAIILVISSHSTYLLFPTSKNLLLSIIRGFGAIGVDLFFVLSGFLIGTILLKNIQQGKSRFSELIIFWKRRWLRTLPNYFLILVLNILLIFFFDQRSAVDIWPYFVFLQNFNAPHPSFFAEAWSLSIEEYAYLLVPLFVYLAMYVFKSKYKKQLFLGVTITAILGLTYIKFDYYLNTNVESFKIWSTTFRKVIIYRIDSIYVGFLLIYLIRTYGEFTKKYKVSIGLLGLLLFVFLHFSIFKFNLAPQTHVVFFVFIYLQGVAISLGLLFPFFLSLKMKGSFKKMVLFISTRSYAYYLINYSIVLLSIERFVTVSELQFLEKLGIFTLYLCATIVLSEFVYRYFERPILSFRNRKFPN